MIGNPDCLAAKGYLLLSGQWNGGGRGIHSLPGKRSQAERS
jgi:hypothetical protein